VGRGVVSAAGTGVTRNGGATEEASRHWCRGTGGGLLGRVVETRTTAPRGRTSEDDPFRTPQDTKGSAIWRWIRVLGRPMGTGT